MNEQEQAAIIKAIERDTDTRITDLHVWHVGPRHYSASVSVVTHEPQAPEHYKHMLRGIPHLAHVLIEVDQCPGKFSVENAA